MKVYVLDSSRYGELKIFKDKAKAESQFNLCRSMLDEDEYEIDTDEDNYFIAYRNSELDGGEYASLEEYEVIE